MISQQLHKILLLGFLLACKLSSGQVFDWAHRFGGTFNDQGQCVTTDNSGNSYISGYFRGTADFDPGPGEYELTAIGSGEVFICKFDQDGALVWAGVIHGEGCHSISLDNSGNVYTMGPFGGTGDFDPGPGVFNLINLGSTQVYICKLDADGNFLWAAGINGDWAPSLVADDFGNTIITGIFSGTCDFNPGVEVFNLTAIGTDDAFICKLNQEGNFMWAKQIGVQIGKAVAATSSGDIYMVGEFAGTADFDPDLSVFNMTAYGGADLYLIRFDAAGNFISALHIGGGGSGSFNNKIAAFGMDLDPFENLLITGYFKNNIDFDPGPGTLTLSSNGDDNVFILKLSLGGDLVWVKQFTGYSEGNSIASDAFGNVYTAGNFAETTDFDPGTDTINMVANGLTDGFVSILDAAGNYLNSWKYGTSWLNETNGIAVDDYGSIYSIGYFQDTVDFDPDTGVYYLGSVPAYYSDIFLHKMAQSSIPTVTQSLNSNNAMTVFPNPAIRNIMIVSGEMISDPATINIYDLQGKVWKTEVVAFNSHCIHLNIEELPNGLYLLKLENRLFAQSLKLMVVD